MKDNDVKGGRRVVWSPQERQAEFMQRGEYEALYGGAAGGGKSDALLAEALRQADKACYRGIIFRKTYPQLTELEDRSQTLYKGAYPAARYNKTKHCWSFPSGAKIYFGAMQHKKDRLNYQGKHYDFVGFDELTQFSFDEYSYMFSRNRPGGKGTRVYIRATANPGGPGHSWVKQRFITAGEPMKPIIEEHKVKKPDGAEIIIRKSRVFIPASVFDNKELLRNDPEYLASLSMLPTAEKKALLYGDWNSFTGQVFTEWRDDPEHYCDRRWTHVIAPFEIPRHWEIVRGFDFGYTRPFSVGWYAVDTKGCIYRIREYYGCTDKANEGIRLEPSVIAENIRKIERDDPNIRGRNVYGVADPSIFDKSRGESVADLMARSPNFIIWSPGDNARISGKMQYHNRLAFNSDGEAMFYCFNTCREFIRTIPALMYDEKNVEDIDTTMEDHIYDECRYVLRVNENDRDYNRRVSENDRDYAQKVYDSDRNYQIKLNNSLKDAVENEETDSTKFSPSDAYDFISKYGDKIYTDEEYIEALYQLYGDKEGFFDWVEQMEIPGDTKGTTYLELLYEIHPELKPSTFKKMGMPNDELIRRTATGGGATPPHPRASGD